MRAAAGAGEDGIQVHSIVVITRTFAARPSSIPDIRSFVRQHLTQVPLSEDDVRLLTARVVDVLLDAAGTGRAVEVALRIFTSCAEVDVLQTGPGQAIGSTGYVRTSARPGEDRGQQTPAHVTAVGSSTGGTDDAA